MEEHSPGSVPSWQAGVQESPERTERVGHPHIEALSTSWPYELQNLGLVPEHLSKEVPSEQWETQESFSKSVPTGQPHSEARGSSAAEAVQ